MTPTRTERATKTPDLNVLLEEWNQAVNRRDSRVYARAKNNVNRRTCWWPGQTDDGRKWAKRGREKDVFPWPGASDTRVHLVDLYCRSDAAMLMAIWRRNKIVVSPTEINDAGRATKMTQVLRWMKYTQMREYPSEARLLANYMLERGAAVQGMWWVQRRQMGYETVTVPQLLQLEAAAKIAAQTGGDPIVPGLQNSQLAGLSEILADPTRDEEAYVIADVLYPETRKEAIEQAIADLRDSGEARIPRPYMFMDRPKTCALVLNEDVFLPPECGDIDESTSYVHWRELVTETTLKARQDGMEWDAGWVEEVIKTQRGKLTNDIARATPRRSIMGSLSGSLLTDTNEDLYEVIHTTKVQYTEDKVPVITCTVWHPGLTTKSTRSKKGYTWAHHTELTYDHGLLPYIVYRREMRVRPIDDSRGVGEIAGTWEDGIKAEDDSSRDRNSLNTIPPSYHPPGRAPSEWGPGAQIETNVPERYGFFKGVGWDVGSRESREVLRDRADRYFGRQLPDGRNQLEATTIMQDLADTWMEATARADSMTLQLCQQYLPDELSIRLVGEGKGAPIRVSRAEIQGQFDLSVNFNVQNLDKELVKEKVELMTATLQLDRNSRIDVDGMIGFMFDLIDPQMGERVIRPEGAALDQELKDEADAFARMFAGIQTDVHPGPGQAWEARMQWLQSQLQTNATAIKRLKEDPHFAQLVETRLKQLNHQYEQYTINPQRGRTGA